MRTATSLLLVGAFLAISLSSCGADDLIQAQTIPQGNGVFSTGADTMSLLNKLFKSPANETRNKLLESPANETRNKMFQSPANQTRTARQRPSVWPEIVSRLPVSRLFDFGSKVADIARFWPAGLASLVVGSGPTTGAIVGIIAISIFVIVIWLVIYSIGVVPVGAALGRNDLFEPDVPFIPDGPFPAGPYPYRFKRSLAEANANVMNAMDQFQLKQLNNKEKVA